MIFNYFEEIGKEFFFRDKSKYIKYSSLYSSLKKMKINNIKENTISSDDGEEHYKIKIIKVSEENKFEFKIKDSPKLDIEGQKKIFFVKEGREVSCEVYVYNKDQILKYQAYLMGLNGNQYVDFFDKFEEKIIDKDDDNFFDKICFLKINKTDDSLKEEERIKSFKKIFDCYMDNNYKNEGEKLSFNISNYIIQKNGEFNYIETDSRNEILDSLDDFIKSKDNYVAITGVSGTGKTVTLLKFLNRLSRNTPTCYFNIKMLSKLSNIEILAREFVKLFTETEHYDYYIKLVNKMKEHNNNPFWEKIKQILDFIVSINRINQKIIVIVDQYKLGFDINLNLIKILESEKYKNRIKFIICSSIHETDAKANLTYSSNLKKLRLKSSIIFYKFLNKLLSVENIIKNAEIKDMMKLFNYIPKYYYLFTSNYHEDGDNIEDKKKLKTQIDIFLSDQYKLLKGKLNSFFLDNNIDIIEEYNNICQILQGEKINEINIPFVIQKIPIKYCVYKKNEDNSFQIIPAFDFIYGPLRKVYKESAIPDLINVGKIVENKNRSELGNIFDSLVNYHFDIRKKIFGFEISHVLIVNEIVNFSYIKNIIHEEKDYFTTEINFEKLFDKKAIYLEQFNSNGQCVDGGFLIPIKDSIYYALLLYQSSIKKRKHFTKEFIYNYIYETTKNNINQMLGIIIKKIFFMYIIDADDQNTKKFCNNTGIYYIIYDYKKSKFFFSNSFEIKGFSNNIYDKMEIYKPMPEILELFRVQEARNDLTSIKKIFIGKKRYLNEDKEDKGNNNEKTINTNEFFKDMIKTDNGYKKQNAKLKTGNSNDYENNLKKINITTEKETKPEKIPEKWKYIFKDYDSFHIITRNIQVGNAVFGLPIFYTYDKKYLIIKNENKNFGKYSFYNYNTGEKIKESEIQEALDLLNIFSDKSEEIIPLNALCLKVLNKDD